jgi:predicted PurR-regulated permease PerM
MKNPVSAPNESTQRSHRRQVFWQIVFPLFIGALFAGALFYLALAGGAGSIERSAQIAAILLAFPALALGLGALALILILNSGVAKLIKWLPPRTTQVQRAMQGVNSATQSAADWATKPFILFESWGASLRKVFRRRKAL